ncbi:MAG: hypothetical protein AABX54_02980 [Nanoarchaeota archaeon]
MNKNIILATIGTILTSIAFISAQEQYNCPMGGGMMYGIYGGYGSGMMLFSWVTYILVIALIVAAIYWLIKSAGKKK